MNARRQDRVLIIQSKLEPGSTHYLSIGLSAAFLILSTKSASSPLL